MAKIQKRGEKGAAKNYITRNQALKKLQLSLSDFRRLCILKGIYPREPLHKKRANKGSSAPASFYYTKDIQYLLHEPLLVRFREHKAFAKKLARALGRGEWALAKNLEEAKPVARLDHLVKERYPTFTLALQDLQDPLNLVHLFSTLPTNPIQGKTLVPVEVISECGKLISEWKLWAIKTHALRHVFLGVKGIYYEVDAPGQGGDAVKVRWLEGYEFQQHVPHDVDFRILLTFLELYRTLLAFVMYKLYTEENLVYPPPMDSEMDERGETVGALRLVEKKEEVQAESSTKVSKKEVKKAIKGIQSTVEGDDVNMDEVNGGDEGGNEAAEEEFVERPSKAADDDVVKAPLTTFSTILASAQPSSSKSLLFAPYTFYLSREVSSRTWEFIIRAMGGKVITSLQSPTTDTPLANGITHVLVDRPMTSEQMREMENGRKWTWVQPQWVADCVNRNKILGADEYVPGKLLPPHLSPWEGEGELAKPWLEENADAVAQNGEEGDADDVDVVEEEAESDEEEEGEPKGAAAYPPALIAAAADPTDATLRHAAELEAEKNGTSHANFEAQLKEATKSLGGGKSSTAASKVKGGEEDLRKIMMSNKKAKLYEKMKYSNRQKAEEKEKLETKRKAIEKRKRREGKA